MTNPSLPYPKDMTIEELCKQTAERLGVKVLGRILPGAIEKAANCICVAPWCQKKIEGFRDLLSVREYQISGMCQACQDEAFAPPR